MATPFLAAIAASPSCHCPCVFGNPVHVGDHPPIVATFLFMAVFMAPTLCHGRPGQHLVQSSIAGKDEGKRYQVSTPTFASPFDGSAPPMDGAVCNHDVYVECVHGWTTSQVPTCDLE